MARQQIHFEGDVCENEDCDNLVASAGYTVTGTAKWRGICSPCHMAKYTRPWLMFRKKSCESCGHTPLYQWALEVHHRDGNKDNNEPENLTTLCANCHRDLSGLIEELEGDWWKAESVFKKLIKSLFG